MGTIASIICLVFRLLLVHIRIFVRVQWGYKIFRFDNIWENESFNFEFFHFYYGKIVGFIQM